LTQEIRSGLKERDLLPKEDTPCSICMIPCAGPSSSGQFIGAIISPASGDAHKIDWRMESGRISCGVTRSASVHRSDYSTLIVAALSHPANRFCERHHLAGLIIAPIAPLLDGPAQGIMHRAGRILFGQ